MAVQGELADSQWSVRWNLITKMRGWWCRGWQLGWHLLHDDSIKKSLYMRNLQTMQARSSASTWLVEHIIAAAEGDPGRRTPGKGRFYSQFSFNIFLFRRTLWMVVFMSSLISAPIVAFKSGKRYFLKNRQIFFMGRFDIPRNPCKGSCMSHIFSHWLQFFLSTQNTLGSLRTERTRQKGFS